jgi:hypothetical protein
MRPSGGAVVKRLRGLEDRTLGHEPAAAAHFNTKTTKGAKTTKASRRRENWD